MSRQVSQVVVPTILAAAALLLATGCAPKPDWSAKAPYSLTGTNGTGITVDDRADESPATEPSEYVPLHRDVTATNGR